ncbi:restriction endonuclease, SacI family [Alistipes finegoldii]|uniref:restriction endonuclease, SacI family n=1 Tax=Alistipes finegoldii TaxID=214856 RepID=UPI002591AEA5|nr:restriction endonuclease, SacI family [Alistipes finegoldii]
MAQSVNRGAALKVLNEAYAKRKEVDDAISAKIKRIILGSHLTYRYILVNALLAKATNPSVNPLYLQADTENNYDKAFDARSLCHKVLVPFEREYLSNALGGSNEPFLNKPARFVSLSPTNAVRRGKDKDTLDTLIEILSDLNTDTTADRAKMYLASAMANVEERGGRQEKLYQVKPIENVTTQCVLDFIYDLTTKSQEGEICPLIVASLENAYFERMGINCMVTPHKVNESGASSNEIGDIDIFNEGKIISSIEVKDKNFTQEDVEHAIKKFNAAGLSFSMFIYGRSANFDQTTSYQTAARFGRTLGTYCSIIGILDYAKVMLSRIPNISLQELADRMMFFARKISCKDDTIRWIQECLAKY